jgi:hypothetical protein
LFLFFFWVGVFFKKPTKKKHGRDTEEDD